MTTKNRESQIDRFSELCKSKLGKDKTDYPEKANFWVLNERLQMELGELMQEIPGQYDWPSWETVAPRLEAFKKELADVSNFLTFIDTKASLVEAGEVEAKLEFIRAVAQRAGITIQAIHDRVDGIQSLDDAQAFFKGNPPSIGIVDEAVC